MPDRLVAPLISAHVLLVALCVAVTLLKKRNMPMSRIVWMLMLPVFGPICVMMLSRADGRAAPDGEWFKQNQQRHQQLINPQKEAVNLVPLEEALLMNDVGQRRALMMNMLRSDPRKYLDVLLIARFNDDPETAHYATATLLELQHRMELEMQHQKAILKANPENDEIRNQYIVELNDYCQSGLLEGQLIKRQRMHLATALEEAMTRFQSPELFAIAIGNHLALSDASAARSEAQKMRRLWPQDERSWIESMRVYAQTRDQNGMRDLLQMMEQAEIDWSSHGKERLQFWSRRTA